MSASYSRSPDFKTPFRFHDGRIYDIIEWGGERLEGGYMAYRCSFEVQERRRQEWRPVHVYFARDVFERGDFDMDDDEVLMRHARRVVWEYLQSNHQLRGLLNVMYAVVLKVE
jgi:hypothetical protein